jgi:hypothetical protein
VDFPWALEEWRGVDWKGLHLQLERLADIGALARVLPGTYYIHPLVTAIMRGEAGITDTYEGQARWQEMLRAYCELYNFAGAFLHMNFNQGVTELRRVVVYEEDNYLYVRRAALDHKWYLACLGAMQALQVIYLHSGAMTKWVKEVEAITPFFIQADGKPFPGREDDWQIVMHYRAQIAGISGDNAEVERLQGVFSAELRRSEAVTLGDPVMPVPDGLPG